MPSKCQPKIVPAKAVVDEKTIQLLDGNDMTTKVYKIRWLILLLFMFYVALTTFQFVQYSIITNIVTRYYGVSNLAVNWTSMTFMLFHVIFAYPANCLTNRIGLRWSTILGCLLNFAGTWIKVLSVSPDRFYITFGGQCLVAITQAFVLSGPGTIVARWFPSNEASTATSVCLLGNLIGLSTGFLFTPMIVQNHEDIDEIGTDLYRLFMTIAVLSTVSLALIFLFFKDEPKCPPSVTRAIQKVNTITKEKEGFFTPFKNLMKYKTFLVLCNSYGIMIGVLNCDATLLNQLVLAHFQNAEEDAGRVGLSIIVSGMVGSIVVGVIVDKTQKYKATTVTVCFFILCGQIFFAISLFFEVKWAVYASAIFMGAFMSAYLALGYEVCAEFTYPEPEATSNAILNIMNNIYGILLVLLMDTLLQTYGDLSVHLAINIALLAGLIMTVLTKDEHRRLDARNSALYQSVGQPSDACVVLVKNENS